MTLRNMTASTVVALSVASSIVIYPGITWASTTGSTSASPTQTTQSDKAHQAAHGHKHHRGRFLEDVATCLNMSKAELRQELKTGKSIVEVAEAKGMSEQALTQKLRSTLQARLEKSKQAGKLNDATVNKVLKIFDARISKKLNHKWGTAHHHKSSTGTGQ